MTLAIVQRALRQYFAAAFLAFVAVLAAGQSTRVGGEISAVMQNQTTRPLAVMLIATPLMLAALRRKQPVR